MANYRNKKIKKKEERDGKAVPKVIGNGLYANPQIEKKRKLSAPTCRRTKNLMGLICAHYFY